MSTVGAVESDAAGYEGLRNYIIGGGGRPTAVQAFDASARQPMGAPGSALPGAPGTIASSSAHPGKQTNQRITYARLTTKFPYPATDGFDPEAIYEGDIVFVHRYDGMNTGYDVNKPTRMATIAQLNAILKTYNFPTAPPGRPDAPLRLNADVGNLVMLPVDNGIVNNPTGIPTPAPPPGPRPAEDDPNFVANGWAAYDRFIRDIDADPPKWRWQNCRFLAEWMLDGICCSTEHEHRKDPTGSANSNPGELYNIAIGGPTLMRNAASHRYNMDAPEQHVDDGMRTLDKVFVGLVCYEQRDEAGVITHYMYQYKPFTSRQLAWAAFQRGNAGYGAPPFDRVVALAEANRRADALPALDPRRDPGPARVAYVDELVREAESHHRTRVGVVYAVDDRVVPGGNNSLGPSVGDFQRMCCVWRLGSVLDTQAGMLPYKCATINVVIEEWPLHKLREEYNRFFGESYYLSIENFGANPRAQDLINAVENYLFTLGVGSAEHADYIALRNAHATLQTWMRTDGIDLSQLAADVREWLAIDREWEDERNVAYMRWYTAEPDPSDPNPVNALRRLDRRSNQYVLQPTHARPRERDWRNDEAIVLERPGYQGKRPNSPTVPFDPVNVREQLEAERLYESASPDSYALRERIVDAANAAFRILIERLQGGQPPLDPLVGELKEIGQCAALIDAPGYSGNNLVIIKLADEMHTHWLGLRAAVTFWQNVTDAWNGGWLWPVQP